jgi:hypothetical protein
MKLQFHSDLGFFHLIPVWLPYLDIPNIPDATVFTVPRFVNGHSPPINIPLGFPIGNDRVFEVFVSAKYTHNQNSMS